MRIYSHPSLAELSTLRLGGRARVLYCAEDVAELEEAVGMEGGIQERIMFIGAGSNILFSSGEHDLALVKWSGSAEIAATGSGQKVLVDVDGGIRLPRLLGWCAGKGLSGLEPLAGIPGSVGGAVAMNAGSHGREIGDLLESVRIWTPEGGEQHITAAKIRPGYREMGFPGFTNPLVTGIRLILRESTPKKVRSETKKWFARKKSVQPVLKRTAGCVFKNVGGQSTGRILDDLGFRGKCRGGVCFSGLHANFLVHEKNGTADEALELIHSARQTAREKKNINLETEIRIVPCL
jgi:UDP-N-acetylmuramate dehydrogenase